MAKQGNTHAKSGAATTNSGITDFSVRDVIRTMKKNAKAIRVLQGVGITKPGIKEAVAAIAAEQEKMKNFAMQAVAKQIDAALRDDD